MLYKSTGGPLYRKRLHAGSRVKNKEASRGAGQGTKDSSASCRGIGRRKAVQRLVAGAGGALVVPGLAFGHLRHQQLAHAATFTTADAKAGAADWTPEFLDVHQNESLIALAERIIPGSTKAQVNRFIDLLLAVDTQENKERFLASLGAFEAESRSRFGHPFQRLTEDQQNRILTVASTDAPGNAPGSKNWSWFSIPSETSPERIQVTLRDHFEYLKGWISGAYYSSEVGMRELGWTGQNFHETFPGCEHPDGHRLG
jgi:Gluconate 2-dehydrogenase subunit 3